MYLAGDKINLIISFKYNELGICLQLISDDTNILISPTDKGSLSELLHRTYHSAQFKIRTTQAKAGLLKTRSKKFIGHVNTFQLP